MEIILALAAALVGAVLGAFLGGRAIGYFSALKTQKLAREEEARTLLNLFQALQAELTALWTAYDTLVGEELARTDDPQDLKFAGIIGTSQHYFSVYDSSARLLGTLDPDSAKTLITTYITLKTFFDELNTYRRLTDKHQEVRLRANVNLYEAREVRQDQERYFAYLKKRHLQVKGQVQAALDLLKKFISLGEQARTRVTVKI